MTYEELEALIGPPLCVLAVEDETSTPQGRSEAAELVRACGRFQRTTTSVPKSLRLAQKLSLSYAEPRESMLDPNIYVALKGGVVSSVYIKKDDLGICCMDGQPNSPFYWVGSRQVLHDLIGR